MYKVSEYIIMLCLQGARGRTVKSIEETTSTKIDILNQTTDRLVVVRGDPANCEVS